MDAFALSYHTVLTLHIGAFFINIALVIAADLQALRWVLGWKQTLARPLLLWLHRLLAIGLATSVVTGAYLFFDVREYLLTVPAFYVKMGLVAALIVNTCVIGRHLDVATKRAFADLTRAEKVPLFLSGAVSTVSWIGVFIAAQFLGLS